MTTTNHELTYDRAFNTHEYRTVTIENNRSIKSGEKGCYTVNKYPCESLKGAQEYIDSMIEACGIDFFQIIRKNPLIEGCDE